METFNVIDEEGNVFVSQLFRHRPMAGDAIDLTRDGESIHFEVLYLMHFVNQDRNAEIYCRRDDRVHP